MCPSSVTVGHAVAADADDCRLEGGPAGGIGNVDADSGITPCPVDPEIGDSTTIPLFCYLVHCGHCCRFSWEIALTAVKWVLFQHFCRIDVVRRCVDRPQPAAAVKLGLD